MGSLPLTVNLQTYDKCAVIFLKKLHISQSIGLLHIFKLSLEQSTIPVFNLIQLIRVFIRNTLSEYYLLTW